MCVGGGGIQSPPGTVCHPLGFADIPTVINNTRDICRTTHYDPRCVASCVAVTTAVSFNCAVCLWCGYGLLTGLLCARACVCVCVCVCVCRFLSCCEEKWWKKETWNRSSKKQ